MINVRHIGDGTGFGIPNVGNYATLNLNAAATWIAFSFTPNQNDTLDTIRVRFGAITGTPGANAQFNIYSDNAGVPNHGGGALATVTVTPAAGWQTASGFALAVTRGTQYWVVIKNTHGTPASNNFTVNHNTISSLAQYAALKQSSVTTFAFGGIIKRQTTDSGTTWTTTSNASAQPVRFGFASGEFIGGPMIQQVQVTASAGINVYGKRATGLRLTVPTGLQPNIMGVVIGARKTGTPSGNLIVNAYKNIGVGIPSVVGADRTSWSVPVANISASSDLWTPMLFASALTAVPGDVLDFVLRQTVDGSATGDFYHPLEATQDTDADSIALWGDWNPKLINTTDDSTTAFSEASGSMFVMGVLFQSGSPYNSGGGAGYRTQQRQA